MPSLHLVCFGILVFVSLSYGSLDGCTLYSGGDFIYSSPNGNISPGLLQYDVETSALQSIGDTYKDAHINSFIEMNGILYFSGDILRAGDEISMSIGAMDLEENRIIGVSGGLWTISNSLPTPNSEISPALLFATKGDNILVAGHFTHQASNPSGNLQKLALYDPSTNAFSSVQQIGLCSECSVIALASEDSGRIFVATMSLSSYETQVSYQEDGETQWTTMKAPENENSGSFRILFNSFTLSSETLFAIAYKSSSGLLTDNEIDFYSVSWSLENPQETPRVALLWEKKCTTASTVDNIVYPSIVSSGSNMVAAIPDVSCPAEGSGISFAVYDSELNDVGHQISPLEDCRTPRYFESANDAEFLYLSDGAQVQMFDGESWVAILDNTYISTVYTSESRQQVFTGFHFGYEQSVEFSNYGSLAAGLLFTGGIYSPGTVLCMAEISETAFIIGGDFKYVANDDGIVGAKFSAYYDGDRWKATLESNENNYLPGWRLLSIASIGDTVFGIADQGRDTDLLPLVRWRPDDGWLFLYKRPEILDDGLWDNTVGTVHIDHVRNQVYFGGQFTVGLASGDACSGALIYDYMREAWEPLPANLTRVNTFGSLNNHAYMQVGGQFTYVDENSVHHENYIVLDIENKAFLSSVPSISDSEVFSVSLFPNEPIYSFVGGNFGQYGVEQLRYVGNIWSLSVVGNSPIKPTVYSLESRNEGEILFAGGSFDGKLSKLDIGRQEWNNLIPGASLWQGNIYSLLLSCPGDSEYYSVDSEWDDSSLLGSFYSVADCTIPIGAPDDFVCPTDDSLSVGQMVGLGFTVLITIVILSVIGFFAFRQIKKQAEEDELSVEYL